MVRSPRLDVQVKSETSGKPVKFPWNYSLKVNNYEKLRGDFLVPRILVVLAMPKDVADWFKLTPTQLALRHCAYWTSLRCAPATDNPARIAVPLRRAQKFSPAELGRLMGLIRQGKLP